MPTVHQGEGLYIGFEIRQERPLTEFMKHMPGSVGVPLDFTQLEVACMYPAEIGDRAILRQDRRKVEPIARHIGRKLCKIPIIGATLDTSYGELILSSHAGQPHAVIAGNPSEELLEARRVVAETIREELGIKIPYSHPSGWEVPVARRRDGSRRLPKTKRALPETLTVCGLKIAVRASGSMQDRFKPRYTRGTRR